MLWGAIVLVNLLAGFYYWRNKTAIFSRHTAASSRRHVSNI